MRRLGLAITAFALLAGTSAFAQTVTGVTGGGFNLFTADGSQAGTGDGSASQGENRANFSAFTNLTGDPIVFESSNSLAGFSSSNITTTAIDIGISNPRGGNFDFQSTITAAGMGFYVANTGNGCVTDGTCAQGVGTFGQFAPQNAGSVITYGGVTNIIALAAFQFDVFGINADGSLSADPLYNRMGFTALRYVSPGVLETVGVMNTGLNGGVSDLNGFNQSDNSAGAFTYTWNDTGFGFNVAGSYTGLRYQSTVFTQTRADCIGEDELETCIISFAAFGDPIGRGGDANLVAPEFALLSLEEGSGSVLGQELPTLPGGISGINGERAMFNAPVFVNGDLVFQSTAVVPEPATWGMMIMGFGALGTVMRRRRAFARA